MSVRGHRIAACTTLAVGFAALLAFLPAIARESPQATADRARLRGTWVASLVQPTASIKAEGPEAAPTAITFGERSVTFRNRIEGGDASGAYYLVTSHSPSWIDLKLDAGWAIGVYEVEGDRLRLCINPLAVPEQLGIPTRPRPRKVGPGFGHYYYEFRRASPTEIARIGPP